MQIIFLQTIIEFPHKIILLIRLAVSVCNIQSTEYKSLIFYYKPDMVNIALYLGKERSYMLFKNQNNNVLTDQFVPKY